MKITGKILGTLNPLNLFMFLLLLGYPLIESTAHADVLPPLTLSGEDGGLANGREWKSSFLKDKVNLVLYVDPDKQSLARPLVAKLDSINYSPDSLGVTFILNTGATIIPDFVIRNRLAKKAKTSAHITYVLDQKKLLVRKWNLIDDDLNILLLDAPGQIIQHHHGKMTKEFTNQLIKKLDESIKKGELK